VIIVTGCNEIAIQSLLGDQFKSIKIHYVSNLLYASTGTAYSLYCSFEKWRQFLKPVLLLHADIVYEKAILHGLLSDTNRVQDTIVLDENFEVLTSDEQVVIGQNDLVRELIKGANLPTAAGESLGMNLWTAEFMEKYFNFLSRFFDADTMNSNWEQSIKPFLDSSPEVNLSFTKTYGMRWININYPADFEIAEEIYKELKNDQRKIK
jgi:choline kinase